MSVHSINIVDDGFVRCFCSTVEELPFQQGLVNNILQVLRTNATKFCINHKALQIVEGWSSVGRDTCLAQSQLSFIPHQDRQSNSKLVLHINQ